MPLPSNAKIGEIIAKQQELTGLNEKDALIWVLNEHGISASTADSIETLVQKARILVKRNELVTIANNIRNNNDSIKADIVNKLKQFEAGYTGLATDTWSDIASKILTMPKGKKSASGSAISASTTIAFTNDAGLDSFACPLLINGLNFTPSYILITRQADNDFTIFSNNMLTLNSRIYSEGANNFYRLDGTRAYVGINSRLPASRDGVSYNWIAFE